MKKLILMVAMLVSTFAIGAVSTNAQTVSENAKSDVYVGYQFVRVNPDVNTPSFKFNDQSDSHGANVAFTHYVNNSNVGVTGELAANFEGGQSDSSLVTALGGVTLKARDNKTFQPFVRGLVGGSRVRAANQQLSNVFDRSDVEFAYAVGAGLDVKVSKSVSFRVLQVDYLNTGAFGDRQNNIRLGTGLVF